VLDSAVKGVEGRNDLSSPYHLSQRASPLLRASLDMPSLAKSYIVLVYDLRGDRRQHGSGSNFHFTFIFIYFPIYPGISWRHQPSLASGQGETSLISHIIGQRSV
jgi:hypothetical protein